MMKVCWRRWKRGTAAYDRRTFATRPEITRYLSALRGLLDWVMQQRLDSELPGITLCRREAGSPFVTMKITRRAGGENAGDVW